MSSRLRARAVVATAVVTIAALCGLDAAAQVTIPTLPTTTTTRPGGSASSTSSTTSTLLPGTTTTTTRPPSASSTTTTRPKASSSSSTTTTLVPPGPTDGGGGGGDLTDPNSPVAGPGSPLVPPEAQAIIAAVVRSGPSNTKKLIEALRALEDFGLTPQEAAEVGMGRFPIAGYASYVHDWLYPRFVPTFHFHQGTDIFATYGTPVRAPAKGVVKITNGSIGGLAVYVTQPDGTYWYMAHLSAVTVGLKNGDKVDVGDIVGNVGDSGNAKGGSPHVHFEIHPEGGGAIDPKPYLDKFLENALENVPNLVKQYAERQPRGLVGTGLVRQLVDSPAGVSVDTGGSQGPSRTQLLWASSANPTGGAIRLAEAEAARAARTVDWERRAEQDQARQAAWALAETRVRELLAPLSTPAVAAAMASADGLS